MTVCGSQTRHAINNDPLFPRLCPSLYITHASSLSHLSMTYKFNMHCNLYIIYEVRSFTGCKENGQCVISIVAIQITTAETVKTFLSSCISLAVPPKHTHTNTHILAVDQTHSLCFLVRIHMIPLELQNTCAEVGI